MSMERPDRDDVEGLDQTCRTVFPVTRQSVTMDARDTHCARADAAVLA